VVTAELQPLANILEAQHHVLSRAQAAAHGLTDDAVAARLHARRWQRLHPGIYSTRTGPPTVAARNWAALLACGAGAVLSHQTAAALYGMPTSDSRSHVSVPADRHLSAPAGVVVHRSRRLAVSRHPVLTPPRTRVEATIVDLIGAAPSGEMALALVAQACQRRLTTAGRVRAELLGRRTVRWRAAVLAPLGDIAAGAHSLLELRYLRDVERRHRLPTGRRQRPSVGRRGREWTDVGYLGYATTVELDGRLGHDAPSEVWRDSRRDNAAVVAGEAPLRYGWAEVTMRPCAVAAEVALVLKARGWNGQPAKCGRSCAL